MHTEEKFQGNLTGRSEGCDITGRAAITDRFLTKTKIFISEILLAA